MPLVWKFSHEKFSRLEIVLLLLAGLSFFLVLWLYFPWLLALTLALFFVIAYFLIAHGIKGVRKKEIHYQTGKKHMQVTKIVKKMIIHEMIPLHRTKDCHFDKFLLRGFLVSREGKKHRLYFNSREEMQRFRKHLQQHMMPKKAEKRGKRRSLQEQIGEAKKKLRST